MSVLFVAVPAALILGGLFVAAFIWAVRRGEMDDLSTPPVRMLFDDDQDRDVGVSAGAEPTRRPR